MEFEDIPQEIIEQYGIEICDTSITIKNPEYINIKNAKITESLYTYDIRNETAWVTIHKKFFHTRTNIF